MKNKKQVLLTIFIALHSMVYAQDSIPKFLSKITLSLNYKSSLVTSNKDYKSQITEVYFGYKFKNKFSIGVNSGIYQHLNYSDSSFTPYSVVGIGIKYMVFELGENSKKVVGIEPYVNFNYSMGSLDGKDDFFSYYDVGINMVYPKAPYCYFGTGIMQNFYNDSRESLFSWYFSFGLRF